MQLILKKVDRVCVDPSAEPNRVDITVEGIEEEELLLQINILTAIKYFGITELLDTIGEERIKSHLQEIPDAIYTAVS